MDDKTKTLNRIASRGWKALRNPRKVRTAVKRLFVGQKKRDRGLSPSSREISKRLVDPDVIARVNDPRSLLIVTHQKAGTHLLRYSFVNYFLLLENKDAAPADFDAVQRVMPNMRAYILAGRNRFKQTYDFGKLGFSDVLYTHVKDDVRRTSEEHHLGKQIHCIRNPLDFLISIWHYNYLQRDEQRKLSQSLTNVLEYETRKWASQVAYMRRLSSARPESIFTTSYEKMKTSPVIGFRELVEFAGLPCEEELIQLAAERSTIEQVRKEEDKRERPIVASIKGKFTRDGSIGQWKQHMSRDQVER